MKKAANNKIENFKDKDHNPHYISASRIFSSHTDRVKLGLSTYENETNPYPLYSAKTFSESKANHLYNSKGVMTGLG